MSTGLIVGIVLLLVALIAVCLAFQQPKVDSSTAENETPTTEEGRKIAVMRGTTWVTSTQITAWTDDYTTGG